jgi:hypothetical protein
MMRETPVITVELQDNSSFTIEELTFNPYISVEPALTQEVSCNIWIEFVLRNSGGDRSLPPNVILSLRNFDKPLTRISTQVPEYITGIDNGGDLNFIMYSDIWYSFVQLANEQYEFMSSGYKKAVRTLYTPNLSDSQSYLTGSYRAFSVGKLVSNCARLTDRVRLFNDILRAESQDSAFVPKPSSALEADGPLIVTPNAQLPLSSVDLEIPIGGSRARFGLRRQPWLQAEKSSTSHKIGYCGTAALEPHPNRGNAVMLTPKCFSLLDSSPVQLALDKDEQVRFWVHLRAPEAVVENARKTLAYFDCIIDIKSPVEVFNAFFRVPEDYQLLGGGVTDPDRYSVPPRLFFVWQDYKPHQCYSHNQIVDKSNESIHLSTTFVDRRADQTQLITVFALSAIVSLCGNVIVTVYFGDTNLQSSKVAIFLGLFAEAIFAIGIATGVQVYLGARIIWRHSALCVLIMGLTVSIAVALSDHAKWIAILAFTMAIPAAMYSTGELQRWWRILTADILFQFGVSRWWLRRRLIRSLREDGL